MTVKAVLFDLDGTLLDTAPDLAAALNELRAEHGLAHLPFACIRPHVSHGAVALVKLGFPQATDIEFTHLRERFLQFYAAKLAVHTRLFPGFGAVLDSLDSCQLKWGIVTNKPAFLTEPLLEQLGLSGRCACIVSGDTLPQRKPHPAPLLHAAKLLDIEPGECIYIGDAERDIQAARAAGMRALVAGFGYLGLNEDPTRWAADALMSEPRELLAWLNGAS